MDTEAFQQWGQLFTEEVEEIWSKEKAGEFKTATMVLFVLKREFKSLLCNLDNEFNEIKLKYNNVNEERKERDQIHRINDESIILNSPPALKSIENVPFKKDNDILVESSDDTICPSPKLTRQKYYKRKKPKLLKTDDISSKLKPRLRLDFDEKNAVPKICDIFQDFSSPKLLSQHPDDVIDCTVINGTPNVTSNSKKGRFLDCSKKRSIKKFKRGFQNNTLTQMLLNDKNVSKENQKMDDTRFTDKSSVLLENPFNTTESENVSKIVDFKHPKEIVCKDPVVRGKERLKLEGWDCEECQKFYGALDLNSQEAKKLLNKCSKHRATRKPADYTIPGYWTLSFTQTQEKNKPELEQNKTDESTFFQF